MPVSASRGHVWGVGESPTMRAVRDRLRGRPGVEQLQVLGYWSRAR
jgi:NADPH-dependent ferric siderophore reductase